MSEPLTPLEALKHLQVLTDAFEYIAMDKNGKWFVYDSKPYIHWAISYWEYDKHMLELENANIKYDGDWKDSLFTTTKEDTDG